MQGVLKEHWLQIHWRPGPCGESGAARDELLRRLEDDQAAVCGGSRIVSSPSRGNTLTIFVQKYPVRRAYLELSNGTMKFAVKCRREVVLRNTIVDFSIPWRTGPRI